jgi:hypothetical protein
VTAVSRIIILRICYSMTNRTFRVVIARVAPTLSGQYDCKSMGKVLFVRNVS